jgi:GntR family transcriptional regulator
MPLPAPRRFDADSLALQVKDYLLNEMCTGRYSGTEKLPPEETLASDLGVSRVTLRHALISLEKEGFVQRRQGIGTLVNRRILQLHARLDVAREFSELIRSHGLEPEARLTGYRHISAGADLALRLQIPPEEVGLQIEKLWLGNGQPLIYCINWVPSSLFKSIPQPADLTEPVFELLGAFCREEVAYQITEVTPQLVDTSLAEHLNLSPGTPLLAFDQVGFNRKDQPILYSKVFHRPDVFRFAVVRSRI